MIPNKPLMLFSFDFVQCTFAFFSTTFNVFVDRFLEGLFDISVGVGHSDTVITRPEDFLKEARGTVISKTFINHPATVWVLTQKFIYVSIRYDNFVLTYST